MSTEHSFPVVLEMSTEQLLAVVRFAYSQVVRNGWSKQDCTSYLNLIGFSRFACDTVYNYIVECVAFDMIAWNADRPERSEFLRSYSRVEDNSVWIYPFLGSYSRVEYNSVWMTGYYSKRCVGAERRFVHEDNIKQKDRPTDVLAITSSGEEDRPNLLMYENRLNENRLFEILNELFTSFGYASPSPNEPWVYNEDSDDDSLPELSDSFEILNGNDRLLSYASPNPVYCGIVSAHLQVIMNDYPERCANTSLVTGYGYAGYASPNPNEAPVYNEDDSNGDSDDDSLPELS